MVIARGGGRVGNPMQGKIQVRFAMLAALAALVAVLVPATLVGGQEEPTPVAPGGVVLLELRNGGQNPDRIFYDDPATLTDPLQIINMARASTTDRSLRLQRADLKLCRLVRPRTRSA
jgi:hypothetical protein